MVYEKFFKIVIIFWCCVMSVGNVSATSEISTENGVLTICSEKEGDIVSVIDLIKSGQYKHLVVSGKIGVLDMHFLDVYTTYYISIDLTEAQVPFNKIMTQNFMDFEYLEEFKCPKTITSIESQSFNNCPNLRRVVFPRTLKKIEYETFQDCPKLEVEIPSNVEIGEDAFTESKVTIIDPVTESESPAHRFCSWFLDFFRGKDKVR